MRRPDFRFTISLLAWSAFALVPTLRAQSASPDRDDYKSQLDAPASPKTIGDPNAYRILCIGDSITRHGASEDTRTRLGWDHVAGMAATSEEKDYAHLLASRIQATMPDRPVELSFHTSGGSGSAKQRLSTIQEALPIQPHLVIIQLGEHEKEADGAEALRENYEALITSFQNQPNPPRIIATGVWSLSKQAKNSQGKLGYTGWTAIVENTMRTACEKHGVTFISVSEVACDPACHGWGDNPGVKWHPNDKGHEGYASRLFEAYRATPQPNAG